MKILKRHYKVDMMLTLLFDSSEVRIQGYNNEEVQILANTTIPISSFKKYVCEKELSINVPINVKQMGGECERIEIFEEDSWRVTARFTFKDRNKYEVTYEQYDKWEERYRND